MTTAAFRGPQVCRLVGITYKQLDYWARVGILSPSVAKGEGSGTQRVYSYRDVAHLTVMKVLLDAGVSLQRVRLAINALKDAEIHERGSTLLVSENTTRIIYTVQEIMPILAREKAITLISLGAIEEDLERRSLLELAAS